MTPMLNLMKKGKRRSRAKLRRVASAHLSLAISEEGEGFSESGDKGGRGDGGGREEKGNQERKKSSHFVSTTTFEAGISF